MSNKTIAQLDAKTPLITDLVPVADPVTGIAGKSSVTELLAGKESNTLTISPSQDGQTRTIIYRGSNNAVSAYYRTAEIPLFQGAAANLSSGIVVSFLASGYNDPESTVNSVVINSEYLNEGTTSSIRNIPNATSISAPNLKSASLSLLDLLSVTSLSLPEITTGKLTITGTISMTGILTIPKFTGYQFTLSSQTALSGLSLPNLTTCYLTISFASTTSAPNFSSISAPLFKYSSGIDISNTPLLTNISFPELETIAPGANFTYPIATVAQVNLPKLIAANSIFATTGSYAALTSINYPKLKHLFTGLATSSGAITLPLLASIDLPELECAGFPVYNVSTGITKSFAVTSSSFLNLTGSSPNLTSISLPKIKFMAGTTTSLNITNAANLSVFNFNATPKYVGGNFVITGAALNQASVDGILVALAYMDGTANAPFPAYSSKTINLSGGTSATPSATGLAAKATLVARGCTVTHN